MDFLIILSVVAIVFLALAFAFWRWLWRKGRVGKGVVITLASVTAYFVYTAIYPTESFYRDEFLRISGTPLPESAIFLHKAASYPDFHGDHTSCAIVTLPIADFNQLIAKLPKTSNAPSTSGSECRDSAKPKALFYAHRSTPEKVAETKFIGSNLEESVILFSYSSW